MMKAITQLFATLLSSCLIPHKKSEYTWQARTTDSLNDGLKLCIPVIKGAYSMFLELDPPKEMSDVFRQLLFDLRYIFYNYYYCIVSFI